MEDEDLLNSRNASRRTLVTATEDSGVGAGVLRSSPLVRAATTASATRTTVKRDPRTLTSAAERMLPQLQSPLHRAIIQNYRLHALLEVAGRGQEIWAGGMGVDRPVYKMVAQNEVLEGDEVRRFYQSLVDNGTNVMILEPETLIVGDWGFASEALFHTYITGANLQKAGVTAADPGKKYISSSWVCMMWPYTDKGLLIGEHVYGSAHPGAREIREATDEEFIDTSEVSQVFAPLIDSARADLNATYRELARA